MSRPFQFTLVCLAMMATGQRLLAQDPALALDEAVVNLVERIEPSVVSIARVKPPPREPESVQLDGLEIPRRPRDRSEYDFEHPDFEPNQFGAGLLITSHGGPATGTDERFVLTNYHVVKSGPVSPNTTTENGSTLLIRFHSRKSCSASIIAADPRSDLAVLRLHTDQAHIDPSLLKPVDWSNSPVARKGQFVLTFGNPHALARDGSASVAWGMISNISRRPSIAVQDGAASQMLHRLGNLMQIDARLNLGTSGGPVVNMKGELVGLSTSLATVDGYEKSAGFAIPIDSLTRRLVKTLAAGHEVEYGMIGIAPEDVPPRELRQYAIKRNGVPIEQGSAARIAKSSPDSPADRAELEVGDILLQVNNEPILSQYDLTRLVGLHPPESELELHIWRPRRFDNDIKRENAPFTVKVRLAKWAVRDDEGIIETVPRFAPWRGLTVDYPTGRHRFSQPDRFSQSIAFRQAVVVLKSAEDSPARAAGLQPGDFISHVNRTAVSTPAEFHAAVKLATGQVTLRHLDGKTTVIPE